MMLRRTLLLAALSSLAACGGSSERPAQPAARELTLQEGCEAFFARARECREPYVDQLVGVRIELDKPAGIAAKAEAEGKAALVAQAQEEFEVDSQPAAVHELCTRVVAQVPPEQVDAMRAQGEHCMSMADCDGFAACSVDINRSRIAAGP
jgi:hypothetical protein